MIRKFIVDQNNIPRPVTAMQICREVAEKTVYKLAARSMRRALREMGFYHGKGRKRHFMAEREANVAFRRKYLDNKLKNRNSKKNPKRPEVFLDESFCNVNHQTGKTWLTSDKTRFVKSGKGAR